MVVLAPENKPRTTDDIDRIISAELPDPKATAAEHRLHRLHRLHIVADCMMHGPCGAVCPTRTCMKDGLCSKHYPRQFQDSTTITDAIYPTYRRRDQGRSIPKQYKDK